MQLLAAALVKVTLEQILQIGVLSVALVVRKYQIYTFIRYNIDYLVAIFTKLHKLQALQHMRPM